MTNQQMELGFGSGRKLRPTTRRQRRLERAAWWFDQMRQAVDRALDWQAMSPDPTVASVAPGLAQRSENATHSPPPKRRIPVRRAKDYCGLFPETELCLGEFYR